MTKTKIARRIDSFYEKYLFYEWSDAQGFYTINDIADSIATNPTGEIESLKDILTRFEPNEPGYNECISLINDLKNL